MSLVLNKLSGLKEISVGLNAALLINLETFEATNKTTYIFIMPKNQIDYSKVYIYKICCKDISINDIYVGHTTNFEQRKNSDGAFNCNHNNYCFDG